MLSGWMRIFKNLLHKIIALFFNIYFGFPVKKIKVIGVTGTDGKTTTVHLIYEILKSAGKRASMISSVYAKIGECEYETGFHVTTPNSYFLQKALAEAVFRNQEYLVLEVTSHALDQNRVFGIPFEIGVLTNVTSEHLDYHKSYETYLAAKLRLLLKSKTAVVNCGDESFHEIIKSLNHKINKKLITYGIKKGNLNTKSFPFSTKLPGQYNKLNCLAAIAAAKESGVNSEIIRKTIFSFKGVTGRFEEIPNGKKIRIIIDFAHTANALLQVLTEVKKTSLGRVIHLFGCAGLRDFTKRPQMGEISARLADITIITEEDYRTEDLKKINKTILSGIEKHEKETNKKHESYIIHNRYEAIVKALQLAKEGDTVVLTGKGHEKSLCRGKKEFPWSEHKAVFRALKNRQ